MRSQTLTTSATAAGHTSSRSSNRVAATHHRLASSNKTPWVLQGTLAAVFLFAGVMKLVTPASTLEDQSDFPVLFMRFIGVCEALGGVGLVLPWALHIRPALTPI